MINKKTITSIGCVVATAALAFALASCGNSETADPDPQQGGETSSELTGSISINGSTSMEKVIGTLAEQFMADNPGVTITYDATGSGTGVECARNGSADIGLASRALKADEAGLESITVALDGIAIIVNEECGVDDLSLEQVTAIFKGEITNWSEVGGSDLEIACVGRESGSGTRDGFESITDTEDACKLAQELTSTGAVITAVSSSKNAIGYASLSAVQNQKGIKAITVDGVACTEETVMDGSYKIQRPFNFILQEDADLSAAAQAFVDFATSAGAQDIIRAADAVPVK
jgi:phosphate transport system substrate-binding protein